jgi:hypothetical protein
MDVAFFCESCQSLFERRNSQTLMPTDIDSEEHLDFAAE